MPAAQLNKSYYVCDLHFESNMFQKCVHKRLTSTAYPSICFTAVHTDTNQTLHAYGEHNSLDETQSATATTHVHITCTDQSDSITEQFTSVNSVEYNITDSKSQSRIDFESHESDYVSNNSIAETDSNNNTVETNSYIMHTKRSSSI